MPVSSLAPLRVLDFSRILAGPFATMVLADLGATVIKVERPGAGDDTRSWGPPWDSSGRATYFQAVNRNKTSIALDLAEPSGRAKAIELAQGADVLIENFRPGVMDSHGLGYEALREEHRRLVYCSITGFGSGAGTALTGYDLIIQALGGLMDITGDPDGPAQKTGVAIVDVLAGLFASVGILAAIRHRDHGGPGQKIEIELLTTLLAALSNQATAFTAAGVVPTRLGNAHPSIAPYEPVPTQDGELVLAVGNDAQFRRLCEAIGLEELADDVRFATNTERVNNRQALRLALADAFVTRPGREWEALLVSARVPVGRVNNIEEAFALASRLGLDPIVQVEDDEGREVRLPRSPLRLSATPATYRHAAPAMPLATDQVNWETLT